MNESVLIRAKDRTPSPTSESAVRRRRGVPPALLQDAPRRLRIASLVIGALALFALVASIIAHVFELPGVPLWVTGVQTILLIGTLIVYLVARNERIPPERVVDTGMAFFVLGAFALALAENLTPREPGINLMAYGISRITIWIVLFPLIVPNTPFRSLMSGFVAATMGPLTYYLTVAIGNPPIPSDDVFKLFLPNFVAVALSAVPILIIHHLGQHATKATELGSYRLVELLGRGGMGEVWKAQHRMLARPAAIKLIRPEALGAHGHAADSESVSTTLKRFEREAQATAALTSPHTIELYDFGVSDDGTFYYVMELLCGLDLETVVERFGPVSPERVVYLMQQLCCSLADAHLSGMVHRDIKPANIFVCRRGIVYDFVKVLDFGLVKSAHNQGDGDGRLTVEGMTTGTPAFIPPEVALGKREITPQADIYSAGCVAYWLLTGQFVFEGETPMEMIVSHAQAQPSPPSAATEIPIPAELDRIILQCLEKEPARRPESAEQLMELLGKVPFAESWSSMRARRWWQTNVPHFAHCQPSTEETHPALGRAQLTE